MNPPDNQHRRRTGITNTEPPPRQRAGSPGAAVAEVTPVPEPFRQRVRGPNYKLIVNLIELHPLICFFGGGALAGLGVWQIVEKNWLIGCLLLVAGLPIACWGIYVALCCSTVTANRWIERRLRYEISQRADSLVEARDPESMYVSLIPREHFSQVRWTYASDLLLLKIDAARRQVLLEGDSDRYRIPADAIARCDVRPFTIIDPAKEFWILRLVVHFQNEKRELLLNPSHANWKPSSNASRQHVARKLRDEIEAMLD
jgi:hypothetical protein